MKLTDNHSGMILAAYTAGFVDGEGSLQLNPSKNKNGKTYFKATFSVVNNDEAVIKYLHSQWNTGTINEYKTRGSRNGRNAHYWRVYGRQMIPILESIMPYLITKKPHSELLLEFFKYSKERGQTGPRNMPSEWKKKRLEIAEKLRELNDANTRMKVHSDVWNEVR